MNIRPKPINAQTQSVCPVCLKVIDARRVNRSGDIYLDKTCPEHGKFSTVIWRGTPEFNGWVRPKTAAYPAAPQTVDEKGCPYDCGLCPGHRQITCCALLEVTQRCDLVCPVCYAGSGINVPADPTLEQIEGWYKSLLSGGSHPNIQLSGGEPCVRDDLPEIISLGKSLGFTFFQLNTNGLRLARDQVYLDRLVSAGLSTVFLQFDGMTDEVYRTIRGRELLEIKLAAIQNCARAGVGVVLVPTLFPDINVDQIGEMIKFALSQMPTVRGVHFQPASFFGRTNQSAADQNRITIPEVITAIETQTDGRFKSVSFRPPGGENALCSFHGNFVPMPDGQIIALTKHKPAAGCCSQPEDGNRGALQSREFVASSWRAPETSDGSCGKPEQTLGEWDTFLGRVETHKFCISGMAFQDCWNLDIERLKDCYIHVVAPDGRLVPFCAYNLTNIEGRSLYRNAL